MIELTWWQFAGLIWIIIGLSVVGGIMIGVNHDDYKRGYDDAIQDAIEISERYERRGNDA